MFCGVGKINGPAQGAGYETRTSENVRGKPRGIGPEEIKIFS